MVVFVNVDAPELAHLRSLGFEALGETTKHGNFGTAWTAIFFANSDWELLWVEDRKAAAEWRTINARLELPVTIAY